MTSLLKIKIGEKNHQIFGIYGSEKAAKKRLELEREIIYEGSKFGMRKIHVGKSVDPAYSNKEGCAYVIYYK